METIIDLRTALYALIALGVLLLLLRFGKIVVRYLLIFGVLAVAGIFGLALYEHNLATRQAVQVAAVGAAGVSVAALALAVLAVTGGAGYFYIRWRLAEGRRDDRAWLPGPNARWRRRSETPAPPVVYTYTIAEEDEDEGTPDGLEVLECLDLEKWGFR